MNAVICVILGTTALFFFFQICVFLYDIRIKSVKEMKERIGKQEI